jgi:hypothetical protein
MSAYRGYAGIECIGAVLHALEEARVPLRIVEMVTVSLDKVHYRNHLVAHFKWFSLDPLKPSFRTALLKFDSVQYPQYEYSQLYTDGSVEPKLVLSGEDNPAFILPEVTPEVLEFANKFFYPQPIERELMEEAGAVLAIGPSDRLVVTFTKEEGIEKFLAYTREHLRWKQAPED